MSQRKWTAVTLPVLLFAGVSALQAAGDAANGKTIFETKCGLCHNADNKDKKIGPGLKGIKDGKMPSGKDANHDTVLENLNKGGGGMPAFEKLLSDQEKEDVVAYVLTL